MVRFLLSTTSHKGRPLSLWVVTYGRFDCMLLFCLWISRLCLLLSLSKSRVYEIWYSCNILFTCLCKLFEGLFCLYPFLKSRFCWICLLLILEDPGADSGGEGKSKRAEKYGKKKSKQRREEPLGTMSCQTSSKWSPPFWLLIGAKKLLCFSDISVIMIDN